MYIEDPFHNLTDTIKLIKLANASLLVLVLITFCNKQFKKFHSDF